MNLGNPVIIGINTVILYILAAILVGLLCFLMIRNALKMRKLKDRNETGQFEGMPRSDKQIELKLLLQKYPCLAKTFEWLDARLMEQSKAAFIQIELLQTWCCEDKQGKAEMPIRCRPEKLVFTVDQTSRYWKISGFKPEQYLTSDQVKLLSWGIMERCRTLLPFRQYHMRVKRTTRTHHIDNNIPVQWKNYTAVKEDYTIEII